MKIILKFSDGMNAETEIDTPSSFGNMIDLMMTGKTNNATITINKENSTIVRKYQDLVSVEIVF